MPGELAPPPPRAFFGRDKLIEEIVHLAESLTPIALTGVGGIGKTSIVLTALHDDRIKQCFGEDRRFIRCDEFPASCNSFLRRLSRVIGAGIENPESLASLRPLLSSRKMFIVLDNVESVLDPQEPSAQEIYAAVDELSHFNNICLCITSRISTIPPDCEILEIPTLSTEAAHDTFYRIYKHGERSNSIDSILEQLEFHPLSITLFATVARQNKWGTDRLTVEWTRQRTAILDAKHSGSLAATIELSLASPTFRELGPDARKFLEVVAFFPQGVNEENIHWQYPSISDAPKMLDEFCVLSLTYRKDGIVTMLAPLRDHLRPKAPASFPLLSATMECYFARLSGDVPPDQPGFEETRWIALEDVNIEHLLDVFTTIDGNSRSVWDACARFMAQLHWRKSRLVTLGPKIEALPNSHPSKAQCLLELARLFVSVGNLTDRKRLLNHALKLWREKGDDLQVAQTLNSLSGVHQRLGLYKEGIQQAEEAYEICERLGHVVLQARCLVSLAWLLLREEQFDAAEERGLHAINLLPEGGEQICVLECRRVLGRICQAKGEPEKAVRHLETALGIASSLNRVEHTFWTRYNLAEVFSQQGKFGDAQTHVDHAKSRVVNNTYLLARASALQANLWYMQDMFGEAESEALGALDVLEKLGSHYVNIPRQLLQQIDARRSEQPNHP